MLLNDTVPVTYVLPIRASTCDGLEELTTYLRALPASQKIVVDGSPPDVFSRHASAWRGIVEHVRPMIVEGGNGKVLGVLTGLRRARYDAIVVADDDVRYDPEALKRGVAYLDRFEIVRPQNYFQPLPWHAALDTSRTLINRATGGDWPGTLVMRNSALPDGYRADVLFENLEMVRTIVARGGREHVAFDLYIRRLPPTADRYLSQRARQAYDEWARPWRLIAALAVWPLFAWSATRKAWLVPATLACAAIIAAEIGRRRSSGARVFPFVASLLAPLWILERGLCAWIALWFRLRGGIPYANTRLYCAASSLRSLQRRHRAAA